MKRVQQSVLAFALVTGAVAEYKPVDKIVKVLTNMKEELETEAKADEDVNKKMTCWCNDEDKEKSDSIKAGKEAIPQLEAKIDANLFESTRLESEIDAEKKHLTDAQESIRSATAQHEKSIKEGDAKQEEMREYIKALKQAAKKLSKGPSYEAKKETSFLANKKAQKEAKETAELVDRLQAKYASSLLASYTPRQQKLVLAAIKGTTSLKPDEVDPSDEIEAIINEMKGTFERDLGNHEAEEVEKINTFSELRTAKSEEITAMDDQILAKRTQKATAEENAANNKQELNAEKKNLALNEKLLKDVQIRCKEHKEEYNERLDLRNKETTAVAEAISILSADVAKLGFDKTFKEEEKPSASFLQTESFSAAAAAKAERQRKAVQKFAEVVGTLASKVQDKKLVALAKAALVKSSSKAMLDGFEKVKAAIDKYRLEVKDKKARETEKNQKCKERKNENSVDATKYTRDKSDADAVVEQLSATIDTLTKEIEEKEEAVKKLKKEVEEADEERKKQKEEFEKTVAENKETQTVLKNALNVLQEEYEKTNNVALAQIAETPEGAKKAKPENFKELKQNKKGNTVIVMLNQILRDAKSLEDAATKGEAAAEKDHTKFKMDSVIELDALEADVVSKTESKNKAAEGKLAAEDDSKSAQDTLDGLAATLKAIKEDCDFLQEHFQTRMAAYDQEMDALVQTKNILSGAIVQEPKKEEEDF